MTEADKTTLKAVMLGFALLILLVIAIFLILRLPKEGKVTHLPSDESQPGLLGFLGSLLAFNKDKDQGSGSGGGNGDPFWCKIVPKLCEPKELSPEYDEDGGSGFEPSYGRYYRNNNLK